VRSIAAVTVVLAFAAFTVTATAGNPHGTPPGQQASGSAAATASTKANVGAQAQGKAQAKGRVAASAKTQGRAGLGVKTTGRARAATRSSVQASVTTNTSASAGLKPSSVTSHNTLAPASSNATKLYGNGKTAGQIATQAGFGSSTLYGPGNSQPHKVICGPHNVDVHALKAHAAACAAAAVAASLSPTASAQPAVSSVAAQTPTVPATQSKSAGAKGEQASHGGGVLGARAALASVTKPVSRAVLASVRKGTLPFTGLGLWMPILFGLALIAGGYGLRRKAGSLS
jgi:hypothetical protein